MPAQFNQGIKRWIGWSDHVSRMIELMLPAQLPAVSTIELLVFNESDSLGFLDPKSLSQASGKLIEGQVVQDIANLFRQLPPGEPARCHIPPFGLRFHSPEGLRRECSICWMCNNIHGDFQYNFDGAAPVSKRLFSLLDRLAK